MTLAVVWRSGGRLHMASDSRMSFGRAGHADVGVKVMRLPIKVLGTEVDANGHTSVLFRRTYGFCYAGSFTNAGTFKALVEDLLVDVQYVNADVPLSFDGLCRFIRHFSEKVSTEVVATLVEHGRYTFCIAGVCPEQARLRAARFHLDQVDGRTEASFEEIAVEDGDVVSFGSGAASFQAILGEQDVTRSSVLLAINRVIEEQAVDTVGGDIQYGSFDKEGDFGVSGITRISSEEADDEGRHYGPAELRVFRYRGFEMYDGWQTVEEAFWPSPAFMELEVPSSPASKERFVEQCRRRILGG